MHQLTIHHLGPVQDCDISIKQTTVLTGYQASGKSTIAKAIYFFRTVKDDIYNLIQRQKYEELVDNLGYAVCDTKEIASRFKGDFESRIRNKFLNTFGTSYSMDSDMEISYQYSPEVYITIRLREERDFLNHNYVWMEYSLPIRNFLENFSNAAEQDDLKEALSALFDDPYETVYIPAGRSVLTVLGSQINYFYSMMDDAQKRLLDSCTRDYMERVMKLRPHFSNGLEGLLEGADCGNHEKTLYLEALNLIQKILKGKYMVSDGEERIWIDGDRYIKINFASSGQQEVVWIVNLLFYYLAMDERVFFIIEEPESNLFPESQKLIVELITLVANSGNAALITTHSPYVLGAINNMLYAGTVGALAPEQVEKTISRCKWIDQDHCDAFFVRDGTVSRCIDQKLMQIDNSLMDQISHVINDDYDKLFDIESEFREEL